MQPIQGGHRPRIRGGKFVLQLGSYKLVPVPIDKGRIDIFTFSYCTGNSGLSAISRHLQLSGSLDGDSWIFAGPFRLHGKEADTHTTYWTNLLTRHRDGKNTLMATAYRFTIEFDSHSIELNVCSIQSLARNRVAIRLVTSTRR